jgi:alkylated DNA repair protein (DNA oxidative demethylase)
LFGSIRAILVTIPHAFALLASWRFNSSIKVAAHRTNESVNLSKPIQTPLEILPGVRVWPERLDRGEQERLVEEVFSLAKTAPFYRPRMPKSGKPFSVEETNFGSLGWVSDSCGYRYAVNHPLTDGPWPPIPAILLELWTALTGYGAPPECCLVNLYRNGARMGLHQDRDEAALDAPVLSVSLGEDALFRIGGTSRKSPTRSIRLKSGDVVVFGGPARLAFHGIDRVMEGSSRLVPGGGRVNLTLRRVSQP